MISNSSSLSQSGKHLNLAYESLSLAHEQNLGKELSIQFNVPNSNDFTISGDNDSTYCTNDYKIPEIGSVLKKLFPVDLTERLKRQKSTENCGLFPECNRAWMTVDNEIYIWSYDNLNDVTYFDRLTNFISTIALVNPKPDIFQPHYVKLLVVATIVDLSIFGIYFNDGQEAVQQKGEMHLNPVAFYVIKLDNFLVNVIEASKEGQIFLGSQNGVLYEVEYHESYGLFGRRHCKIKDRTSSYFPKIFRFMSADASAIIQICIDNDRSLLYVRTDKSSIEAYKINNNSFAKLSCENKSYELVHMAIVPFEYSRNVHLVAFTKTGQRLYYTTSYYEKMDGKSGQRFKLIHKREFPRPLNGVELAVFDPGCSIMIEKSNNINDQYIIASSDTLPYKSNLFVESFDVIESMGLSVCKKIMKLRDEFLDDEFILSNFSDSNYRLPSSAVFEHYFIKKKYLLFTYNEIAIISKLNHCDQLEHVLLKYGPESIQVKSYFMLNQIQAFVSCLVLMSSRIAEYHLTAQMAARAFFLYASNPSFNSHEVYQGMLGSQATPSSGIRQSLNYSSFSSPQSSSHLQNVISNLSEKFKNSSVFHQSLYMFLDRILWPIYDRYLLNTLKKNTECFEDVSSWQSGMNLPMVPRTSAKYESSITCTGLAKIITKLDDFKNLLQKYPELISAADSAMMQGLSIREESLSLQLLVNLAEQWRQVLSLWHLLLDNNISNIMSITNETLIEQLLAVTFRTLVETGGDLCRSLINILIEYYLKDYAITDTIATKLRNNCSMYYSPIDKNITKAEECINLIRNVTNKSEIEALVNKAVEQYMLACAEVNLSGMARKLASVGAYTGIVGIVLAAATSKDANSIALHFYNNKLPTADLQAKQIYMNRMHCYEAITQTLNDLYHTNEKSTGFIPNTVSGDDDIQKARIGEMIGMVFKSTDQLAHVSVFDWMFDVGRGLDILDSNSPHLEQYLVQRAARVIEGPQWLYSFELLSNFYIKSKKYSAAAKLFAKLAERKSDDLGLQQRVRYLTQASLCLQSSVSGHTVVGDGDLLKEIDDKIEVSSVQSEIMDAITTSNLSNKNDIIAQLNSQLFHITDLYENFATRYNLSKCKLSIVSCASFHDQSIVEAIWKEIIYSSIEGKEKSNYIDAISSTLLEQGQKFHKQDFYFPIIFLVNTLEQLSVQQSLDLRNQYFVAETFIKIGCSFEALHEAYFKLYKLKDLFWSNNRHPFHLIHVNCYIIMKSTLSTQADQSMRFINRSEDSLSYYLLEVESSTYKDVELVNKIQQLQNKLNRMKTRKC